jgi:hypothetical protein
LPVNTSSSTSAASEEDVDLPEVDALLGLVVTGGLQDDEEVALVLLELQTLMRVDGVLYRQLRKIEDAPDRGQLVRRS